jgi:hypothetical protein
MTDLHVHRAARPDPRGDLRPRRLKRPAPAFAVLRQFVPEGHHAR